MEQLEANHELKKLKALHSVEEKLQGMRHEKLREVEVIEIYAKMSSKEEDATYKEKLERMKQEEEAQRLKDE